MFSFIAAEKTCYPVALMCRALEVNRTSFHDWERRAPSDRALRDAWLTERIKEIHEAKRKVYGAPRIHAELRMAHGIEVGRKRVERLMAQAGISGLVYRKRGRTTIRVQGVRVAEDEHKSQHHPVYGVSHAAAAAAAGATASQAFTLHTVDQAEREQVERLYNTLVAAKKKAGENVTGGIDSFTSFVQKKTEQIRKQYKCDNVEYSVEIANGHVKLKAKAKTEK